MKKKEYLQIPAEIKIGKYSENEKKRWQK